MIRVFFGENQFALRRKVQEIVVAFEKQHGAMSIEKLDGENVSLANIKDALENISLFAPSRLSILQNAFLNKDFVQDYEGLLGQIGDQPELIITETKLDKRLGLYKWLQKNAELIEFKQLDERSLVTFVIAELKNHDKIIQQNDARHLVGRVGIDQGLIWQELQKLIASDQPINQDGINDLITASPQSQTFELFGAALQRDVKRVASMLQEARSKEEPHMLLGLIASQATSLTAIVLGAGKRPTEIAKDIGVHPFGLEKLQQYAGMKLPELTIIITTLAQADERMKGQGTGEPWDILENALASIAVR